MKITKYCMQVIKLTQNLKKLYLVPTIPFNELQLPQLFLAKINKTSWKS